ncbi:UNVERIFIED_CONTAM: hypothetical protein FKN15_058809 [Acipenser sinensis]
MASNTVTMPAPVCLIENSSTGQLHVNQQALEILSQIDQPVVVVAIVGLYRTGKSYLMNKLAGKRSVLGSLVSTYVDTISSGSVPCLDNAVLAMAQIENKAAMQQGLAVYQKGMEQSVEIPVTRDRMSEQHGKWEKQALETFMKRSFKDDGHIHQKTLAVTLSALCLTPPHILAILILP